MRFKRLLSNPLKSTRGQVLPAVLAIMVVGGLAIGPSLSFMGSALNSGKLIEARVGEIYAADAGMEHGLWTLKNSPPAEYPYSYSLPDINGFPVNITLSESQVLWGFSIGETGVHAEDLLLRATMAWNASSNDYDYTLALTNTAGSVLHLDYVMVTPPDGFTYVTGTTSGIVSVDPAVQGDPNGSTGLIWDFETPRPSIPSAPQPSKGIYSTVYHRFRLLGPPGYTGGAGYIWVGAEREDVGVVSTAVAMKIVAQVVRNGSPATTATSLVLKDSVSGDLFLGSWLLN